MTAHFNSLNDAVLAGVIDEYVPAPRKPGIYRNFGKRVLDLVLVTSALPVIVLLTFVLIAPIILRGENPFYSQRRVGRNGRGFVMWKIRTMVSDADERLARYLRENPDARQEWALHQKLRTDPRVTPYGRFLRKSSLDEVPQLWNVLKGDMSLIGPRPMMPHQRALYLGSAYYAMRPGVSGYWQVSDRNDCEFASRAMFDEQYDREVSFSTDIGLIFKTIAVMARGTGV